MGVSLFLHAELGPPLHSPAGPPGSRRELALPNNAPSSPLTPRTRAHQERSSRWLGAQRKQRAGGELTDGYHPVGEGEETSQIWKGAAFIPRMQ